jgi:hypothetical protein
MYTFGKHFNLHDNNEATQIAQYQIDVCDWLKQRYGDFTKGYGKGALQIDNAGTFGLNAEELKHYSNWDNLLDMFFHEAKYSLTREINFVKKYWNDDCFFYVVRSKTGRSSYHHGIMMGGTTYHHDVVIGVKDELDAVHFKLAVA